MVELLENFSLREKKVLKKGTIHKIGLIGCGTMGQEIVRIVSQAGMEVIFIDTSDERIKDIFQNIDEQLDAVINRWGLTKSEKKSILSRIKGSVDYKDIHDCNIIIETIHSRRLGTSIVDRQEIFKKVESYVSEDTVIASNVSTLMISDLASVLKHPERAVGLHFIYPANKTKLVEVAKGVKTSDEAYELVLKFAQLIGKSVIKVSESPGNISTRLIVTLINEACETLMEGVASVDSIDETMKMGFGMQFGPFELADQIGLDKMLKWMNNLYEEFGEHKFKPSPILKRLVRANYTGISSGRGFYIYDKEDIKGVGIKLSEIK